LSIRIFFSCIITLIIFISCNQKKDIVVPDKIGYWYFHDFEKDSVLGLSLEKALIFLEGRPNEKVVVALIDTDIDINHPILKNFIWVNSDEKDNGKDDDSNGYVDDVNGWNFTRNLQGQKVVYGLNSNIAVLNTLSEIYSEGDDNDSIYFKIYNDAMKSYLNDKAVNEENLIYYSDILAKIPRAEEVVSKVLKSENFSLKELDSLYKNSEGEKDVDSLNYFSLMLWQLRKYYPNGEFENAANLERQKKLFSINMNYDDRKFLGDDINNLNDSNYGSPIVNSNLNVMSHGTRVAGVLAKFAKISNLNIDIMCLPIQPQSGGFKEKDLFLAIKYAVDNGAKVINLSSSIEYTLKNEIINDAIEYARVNNVMLVTSAGNKSLNLDLKNSFPDGKKDGQILTNFIKVGASGRSISNEKLEWTNYGKNSVDFFAPGDSISTIDVGIIDDIIDSGTSISSILTSAVVALMKSYYPGLKQNEIKEILISTVLVPILNKNVSNKDHKFLKQFSISGGILNAYRAVVMADSLQVK